MTTVAYVLYAAALLSMLVLVWVPERFHGRGYSRTMWTAAAVYVIGVVFAFLP